VIITISTVVFISSSIVTFTFKYNLSDSFYQFSLTFSVSATAVTSSPHHRESFRRPVSSCNVFLGLVLESSSSDQVNKQRPRIYLIASPSSQHHEPKPSSQYRSLSSYWQNCRSSHVHRVRSVPWQAHLPDARYIPHTLDIQDYARCVEAGDAFFVDERGPWLHL
jgi:hypothetical protein